VKSTVVNRPAARTRLVLAAAALAAGGALLAGCGDTVGYSEGTGDRSHGKEVFTQSCGGCHTLADAGTKGQIGPNLDYAFLQSRRDGLGESTIVQVVRDQIAYPVVNTSTGAPGMPGMNGPQGTLPLCSDAPDNPRCFKTEAEQSAAAEDVTSYVAAVAGIGDPNVSKPQTPAPAPAPAPETTPGTGAAGDAAAGKQVFATAGCGGCHTLVAAGASGDVGPDLDELKPDAARVAKQVTNGGSQMPPFKDSLTPAQIKDVAAYVASSTGS